MSWPLPPLIKRLFYPFLKRFGKKEVISAPEINFPIMSIYEIQLNDISGKSLTLADFKGKKMLIVNTASECGYTPQYKQLQELYDQMKDKLVVLGFPCNDFGGQEPGNETEIQSFCERNYGVNFPLFSKIHVVGEEKHPLYQWLSDPAKNGWCSEKPTWNFCKYLIDENGKLLHYMNATVDPFDERITA